ncbi:MAG: manganese efflux pump MntP family protein [Desulfuromusa sp.]|nr:manganese efflux pump MntP family protein [Desulfuromusa sp.]
MDFFTLISIAVALAIDAFAVALAVGAILDPLSERRWFRLGFHFGLFQGLMPIVGWAAGRTLQQWISAYNHWVAFLLLGFIGIRMILNALKEKDDEFIKDPTRGMTLVVLSVATSIDALAIGFSLALLGVSIWTPALVIGIVAAVLTVVGMMLGKKIGALWGTKAELVGGLVLCAIGIKILIEPLCY